MDMLLGCKKEVESIGEERKREIKRGRKLAKKIKLRVATLNVGSMTGKGRDMADLMEQRGVNILCLQETCWKREKARCIGGEDKMWYCGSGNKKNGVGIVLKKENVERVVKLWRVTDRIICLTMKLDVECCQCVCAAWEVYT